MPDRNKEKEEGACMSTPAKLKFSNLVGMEIDQTSICTCSRQKEEGEGGGGLYEYSSQVPISAPIDPRLTSNDANMRKLVFT